VSPGIVCPQLVRGAENSTGWRSPPKWHDPLRAWSQDFRFGRKLQSPRPG